MAIIYGDFINFYCTLDLGRYATLSWNVFLLSEDDKFILFLKNSKLGLVNKKELKSLKFNKKASNSEIDQFSKYYSYEYNGSLLHIFLNKYCKIQTAGSTLDMDGVIKVTLIDADSDSIRIEHKKKNSIIDNERLVYILEVKGV